MPWYESLGMLLFVIGLFLWLPLLAIYGKADSDGPQYRDPLRETSRLRRMGRRVRPVGDANEGAQQILHPNIEPEIPADHEF